MDFLSQGCRKPKNVDSKDPCLPYLLTLGGTGRVHQPVDSGLVGSAFDRLSFVFGVCSITYLNTETLPARMAWG